MVAPQAHRRAHVGAVAHDLRTQADHAGENAGGDAEDVILQFHADVDRQIVLNLDIGADDNAAGHKNILPKMCVSAGVAITTPSI